MHRAFQIFGAVIALSLAGSAQAAPGKAIIDRYQREAPLNFDGTIYVDNPTGSVTVIGTDQAGLTLTAEKISRGADEAAAKEGRAAVPLMIRGDARHRIVQATFAVPPAPTRWNVTANMVLRVPRTVHVRIITRAAEAVRVSNISGEVQVNNVSGSIELGALSGPVIVETINGNIRMAFQQKPNANVRLSSVNGSIDLLVPPDARFNWIGETLRGDVLATGPARGATTPNQTSRFYRGYFNDPTGPTIQTSTVMGPTYLLAHGTQRPQAQSVFVQPAGVAVAKPRLIAREVAESIQIVSKTLMMAPTARTFVLQRPVFNGNVQFGTNVGNIFIGDLRGNAKLVTRAGEIILGRVQGSADVQTHGGPINLGEVIGLVNARSGAGDVMIRAARMGGRASTTGGIIQVGYNGGPLTINSGGGDINVRRSTSSVKAETKSGDVNIAMDPAVRSQDIEATTGRGNISLFIAPTFGADIDATIMTSAPDVHAVTSDLGGLTVTRETVGNRTRIRAVGKINGGGHRVELNADEGNIVIRRNVRTPVMSTVQR
jgi:DUF4097 and DUF4098 domain-containing protein YvlB